MNAPVLITYVVNVYCCPSGNCCTCNAQFNKAKRKLNWTLRTPLKERAEQVKDNWTRGGYDAFITEETTP